MNTPSELLHCTLKSTHILQKSFKHRVAHLAVGTNSLCMAAQCVTQCFQFYLVIDLENSQSSWPAQE